MKKVCQLFLYTSLPMLIVLLSPAGDAFGQQFSSGPHGAHQISVGSVEAAGAGWENLEAARNDDNVNAARSALLLPGQATQALVFQNFDLNIPHRATITGIEVVVIRRSTLPEGVEDKRVQLLKTNAFAGKSLHLSNAWEDQWTAAFYGNDKELWGSKWTPADLNGRGFGIVLESSGTVQGAQADIDEVNVTVHYTLGEKSTLVSFTGVNCQATSFQP